MNNINFAKFWFKYMEVDRRRRLWTKIGTLLVNGVPIIQALEVLHERQKRAFGESDVQTQALGFWIKGMRDGKLLSQIVDGWVSPLEMMLISSGELSGNFGTTLIETARVMIAKSAIRSTLVKGLAYPLTLLLLVFGILFLFGFKIVPAFTKLVSVDSFSGMAALIISASTFITNWSGSVLLIFVSIIVIFSLSLARWDGKLRVIFDKYPPFNIYRVIQGSTWLISLASLLESGIRLEKALEMLLKSADPWLKNRIKKTLHGVRAGLTLSEALEQTRYGFPDQEIIDDMSVYSGTNGFEAALSSLGKEWMNESVNNIKEKMSVITNIGIFCVAILLGSMMAGMMSMQLQLNTALKASSR